MDQLFWYCLFFRNFFCTISFPYIYKTAPSFDYTNCKLCLKGNLYVLMSITSWIFSEAWSSANGPL